MKIPTNETATKSMACATHFEMMPAQLLIVAGFCLGWFTLWKTRQVGREGIWGRAIVGIVINGVLLVGVVLVAVKIAQRLSQ